MHDRDALGELFEDGALLTACGKPAVARGCLQIKQAAEAMWERDGYYVAAPGRVLQTGSAALITSRFGTSVARRLDGGIWRYTIALLHPQQRPKRRYTMSSTTTEAHVPAVPAEEGEARWWWGNLTVIKLTGEDTHGALTVVELTMPPSSKAPPHVHHREDETFLVTRGRLTFQIGDETIEAGPGDFVVGPRDVPHRFSAGADGATVLFLLAPAGLEGLILEQSVPATRRELPAAGDVPPADLERMQEIAHRYGCELLVKTDGLFGGSDDSSST